MFSAISATRLAMREAMMPYGDGGEVLTAPLVAFGAGLLTGFFVREAGVLLVVRLTGADATEAGMLKCEGV